MASKLMLYFDGACCWDPRTRQKNPGGIATYGWIILNGGDSVARGAGFVCRGDGATNNVAEYMALIKGLEAAHDLGVKLYVIKGDSKLVVNQVAGVWRCKARNLRPLLDRARTKVNGVSLIWVPREANTFADDLSQWAYKQVRHRGSEQPWDCRWRKKQ